VWDYPTLKARQREERAVTRATRDIPTNETLSGGFGVVDEKGRLSLARSVRNALGIEPGSRVAYVVLDGALLVVPQDEHLATLTQRAQQALSTAGLTAQDVLDELPAARASVVSEAYGAEFVQEIERLRLAQRPVLRGDGRG
jgi:bifunctional DNA-binding transcriptional regulator/antitoxin component of YhaV-PrlF toxin-antitoxin module